MPDAVTALLEAQPVYLNVYIAVFRWLAPVMIAVLLFRCIKPLLTFRREPEIWAWLCLDDGKKLPVTHWENVIGRSKKSDIVIDFPTVSKTHGVLTRYDDGSWTVADADSKDGVYVNEKRVRVRALQPEDVISIGGVEMMLQPITARQEHRLAQLRTQASSVVTGFVNLLLLSVLQLLCCVAFLLGGQADSAISVLIGFGGIMVLQWPEVFHVAHCCCCCCC